MLLTQVSCKEAINEAIENCSVKNGKSFQCFFGVKVLDLVLSFPCIVSCKRVLKGGGGGV